MKRGSQRVLATLDETTQDKVASFLIASVLVLGAVVAGLLALVLASSVFEVREPVGVEFIEIAGEKGTTLEQETMRGVPQAAPQAIEPAATSADVLDLVAEAAANPDELLLNPEEEPAPGAGGAGGTGREGAGEGTGVIPREQRWSLVHNPGDSLDEYARKLDYLGIELAVATGLDKLLYVSRLSSARPLKQIGEAARERRLYWVWRGRGRREADIRLLRKAGIEVRDGIVVQFLPERIERQMAGLERAYRNRKPDEIKSTRFALRKAGADYELYVMEQRYSE